MGYFKTLKKKLRENLPTLLFALPVMLHNIGENESNDYGSEPTTGGKKRSKRKMKKRGTRRVGARTH